MSLQDCEVETGAWRDRLIFGSLLVLIGVAAVPLGSIGPWWEGIFESVIFMLGAFSVTTIIGNQWRVPFILAPFGALAVLACLQVLPLGRDSVGLGLLPAPYRTLSLNPFETKRFVIELLAAALTLAMLLRFTLSRRQLLNLAHLVIIVGAASAALAFWRRLLPDTSLALLWNYELHGGGFGQFINRNHFALLMEMSLGPTLSLGFYAGSGARRFLYFAIALWIWLALVLANSRGGIISMMGQLAFLSWIYLGPVLGRSLFDYQSSSHQLAVHWFWRISRTLALRCALILFLLGTVSAGVVWLGGEPVRQRFQSVPGEFLARSDDLQNQNPRRLEIWAATWRLIESRPFLGSGLGAYKTAVAQYLESHGDWQPQQAHDEYLELGAGGGIVGGAIGIWFLLTLIRESRKRLMDNDRLRRAVCQGALVGLVGVAIHSLVDFGLHVLANTLICCCLIALATAQVHSSPIENPVR
ncbi:MAG TPA: O-antigen ligase family protein [Pyrinomonadaceae bacterium]